MKINDWKIRSPLLLFILKKQNFIGVSFFTLLILLLLTGLDFWGGVLTAAISGYALLLFLHHCYRLQWCCWPFSASIQKFPAFKPRPLYEVMGQSLSFHASDVKKIIFQFSQACVYLKVNNQASSGDVTCKANGDYRFLTSKINHEIFITPIGTEEGLFHLEFPLHVLVIVVGREGKIIAQQAPQSLRIYLQKGSVELAETRKFLLCHLGSGHIEINNARGELHVHKGVANMQINFAPRALQGKLAFESGAGVNEIVLPPHATLSSEVSCTVGKFSADFINFWKNGTFVIKGISVVGDIRVNNLAKKKSPAKILAWFGDVVESFLLQNQKAKD